MTKMKSGRATGFEDVSVEMIKKDGKAMIEWLVKLCNIILCYRTGKVSGGMKIHEF